MATIGWLKTTDTYSLTVLEAKSLESKRQLGHVSLKALWENLLHASLLVFGGCQHPLAFLDLSMHHSRLSPLSHGIIFSVPVSTFPLEGHHSLEWGATMTIHELNLITSAKTPFPQ